MKNESRLFNDEGIGSILNGIEKKQKKKNMFWNGVKLFAYTTMAGLFLWYTTGPHNVSERGMLRWDKDTIEHKVPSYSLYDTIDSLKKYDVKREKDGVRYGK